jgi:hypothetical protein
MFLRNSFNGLTPLHLIHLRVSTGSSSLRIVSLIVFLKNTHAAPADILFGRDT